MSFRVVPERGCNAPVVPFVGGACIICRAISKPGPSLVFHSQRVTGTHEATGECLAADVSVMGEETIGIWATSSCNLLVPSAIT